jgi:hypothetical protein
VGVSRQNSSLLLYDDVPTTKQNKCQQPKVNLERETMSDSADDDWIVQRERQKESLYRSLYSKLLRANRGLFDGASESAGNEDFAEERERLETVLSSEQKSLAIGVGASLTVFAALRFGPRLLGGKQLIKALEEAEEQAKKRGTEVIQKAIGMWRFHCSSFLAPLLCSFPLTNSTMLK